MTPDVRDAWAQLHYGYGTAKAGREIVLECLEVAQTLVNKNIAYGDSVLDPIRFFSSSKPEEQLLVRIDDKLSRLKRGAAAGEDVLLDVIGYLVLLRIFRKREAAKKIAQVPA
jgi:hypothetical protein